MTEAMHTFYSPTPSTLTTVNETGDIHIRQICLHAIPNNPTPIQLY